MKDINGIEIKVGMNVKTLQPSGGILPPAPAQIGEVIELDLSYQKEKALAIKYEKIYGGDKINLYILLYGKINEIVK